MKRLFFLSTLVFSSLIIASETGRAQGSKLIVWAKSWANPTPTFYAAAGGGGRSYILRLQEDASIECEPISLHKECYPISIENIDFGQFQQMVDSLVRAQRNSASKSE